MRNLTIVTIDRLLSQYPTYRECSIFVETGTYLGDTIIQLASHFEKLYTIEISNVAYVKAREKSKVRGIRNIKFINNDSVSSLKKLVKRIKQPCIFFLDAHVTENNTGFTGRGNEDVPLLTELTIIKNFMYQCVIIIDDYRLFGMPKSIHTAQADWSNITFDSIKSIIPEQRIEAIYIDPEYNLNINTRNDRLIILLKPMLNPRK